MRATAILCLVLGGICALWWHAAGDGGARRAEPTAECTPLAWKLVSAAGRGDQPEVRSLIARGALHAPAGGGLTALQAAVCRGDRAMARLLLEAGADVNGSTGGGWTPLMAAAEATTDDQASLELTEMLLKAGADVSAMDASGRTALSYAEQRGRAELAGRLRAVGGTAGEAHW